MRDFSLAKYDALCAAISAARYPTPTHSTYLQTDAPPERVILLRHDVDGTMAWARHMAEIEHRHGLVATYFFRTIENPIHGNLLGDIAALGHEIGFHYETLALAKGDMARALELFEQHLGKLRRFVQVTFASMHGSPLSKWDNRDIWQHASPADFDLIGEAYRDIDWSQIVYLNDTGRTWHPTRYNLRDHTGEVPPYAPHTTDDLIALVKSGEVARLCISAHTNRWHDGLAAWWGRRGLDLATNSAKVILKRLYASSSSSAAKAGG